MTTRGAHAPTASAAWLLAIRPRTLGASLIPVLVGSAVAVGADAHHAAVTAACLGAALLLQIGTNLANDALDFARGIDTEDRLGPTRVTQAGLLTYPQVVRGAGLAFGGATLLGVYLVAVGGWPILWIGIAAVIAGVAYSGGPFPLASHGLGEAAAFVFFGLVAVTGTTYLHTGAWEADAVRASLPVGALVTCLMVVNNLRDIPSDATSGKRTLAVRLGAQRTRILYALLLGVAFAAPLLLELRPSGVIHPIVAWFSLPLAIPLVRGVRDARTAQDFGALLGGTARLHGVYGLLWAAGIAW